MRASEFITEQPVPPKKPGTIAVVNTPVADKSISMQDKVRNHRVRDFANRISTDNQRYNDYAHITKQTRDDLNSALKQADNQERTAMQKQAKVDQRQGAGQSTIQRVKPVTFDPKNSASNVKIAMDDIQNAIREHVKQGIPFTECMFRAGSPAFTEFYRQVRVVREHLNLDWQDEELLDTDIGECIMVEGELVPLDVPMEVIEEELDERKQNPFQMDLTAYDFPVSDETKYDGEGVQAQLLKSISMNGQKDVIFDNGKTVKVPSNIAEIVLSKINRAGTTQNKFKIIKYISQSYENLMNFAKNDISEAEYQGRKVKLNSPKRGGSKKFYVYTKNKKGNVIKVSWGDTTGLSVKAKDRGAVKSFVARHKCKTANDKTTARYWSCRTPRYKALGVKGGQWW